MTRKLQGDDRSGESLTRLQDSGSGARSVARLTRRVRISRLLDDVAQVDRARAERARGQREYAAGDRIDQIAMDVGCRLRDRGHSTDQAIATLQGHETLVRERIAAGDSVEQIASLLHVLSHVSRPRAAAAPRRGMTRTPRRARRAARVARSASSADGGDPPPEPDGDPSARSARVSAVDARAGLACVQAGFGTSSEHADARTCVRGADSAHGAGRVGR